MVHVRGKKVFLTMGMSASQARLLSITTRLTNNEFRSQMTANSKIRLANDTQAASVKYMEALDSTKLQYSYYNAKGEKVQEKLTGSVLSYYGSTKNQYGLVNTSGQLLVSELDGKNFINSDTKSEFLLKYDIPLTDNPAYKEALRNIYGDSYSQWFNKNNVDEWLNNTNGAINPNFTSMGSQDWDKLTKAGWDVLVNNHLNGLNNLNGQFNGKVPENKFGNWIDTLSDPPEYIEKPEKPPYPEKVYPDLIDEAMGLIAPACWDGTGITGNLRNDKNSNNDDNTWHIEHVLSQYMWTDKAGASNYYNGGTITVNGQTLTNTDSNLWAMSSGGGDGDDPKGVRKILGEAENAALKAKLESIYYDACKAIKLRSINGGLTSGSITVDGTPAKSSAEIGAEYYDAMLELLTLVAEQDPNFMDDYQKKCDEIDKAWEEAKKEIDDKYNEDLKDHNDSVQKILEWIQECDAAEKIYTDLIHNLPPEQIPDESDEKYEWYSNLWHRMNGKEEEKARAEDQSWKILEDSLMNSPEWLKFVLETGVVTLEQVKFQDKTEDTGLEHGEWTHVTWSSTSDISEVDDDLAVTKAEVEYNKTLARIQSDDKKLDNDIKKLDTEHNALQTEYDSIKGVMDKNMERSFKAFS